VTDVNLLNRYDPFSPSVYGETGFDIVETMLTALSLKEDSKVIDLGSGVGNVVLQIAAQARVQMVWGIELNDIPADYARVR
jgi:H3 lysine-79-specific histone-lysine N-methyltransferase